MFFLKSKHNIFRLFFIAMLRMINLFFAFKNKNCCYICHFYHECAFKLTDWLIWLVHQFWLVNLININLLKLTACNYYQLKCKYPLNSIKVRFFFGKHIEKMQLWRHDKNYYHFCKSNIPVINLIVSSRNMIKVSKNMSL